MSVGGVFLQVFDVINKWIFILTMTTIVMTCLFILYNREEKPRKPKRSKYPDFEMNLSPFKIEDTQRATRTYGTLEGTGRRGRTLEQEEREV
jgi:hypothetical protein